MKIKINQIQVIHKTYLMMRYIFCKKKKDKNKSYDKLCHFINDRYNDFEEYDC
jgi:hypothetical protein